jgi:purine nucleosidase
MGGSSRAKGNVSYCAEFNFWSDPEAAHIVLQEFDAQSLWIAPWELTEDHSMQWSDYDAIIADSSIPESRRKFILDLFQVYVEKYRKPTHPWIVCDVYAMAALLYPEIVLDHHNHHCVIECKGETTRGMLAIDWYATSSKPTNVTIIERIDFGRFLSLIKQAIAL